jgi:hypothetical protein
MDNYNYITLQFDQAQQPKFEEKKGKGYVEFGKNNDYPIYLLDLYNESPKHGSIVKSKTCYIYGKGFEDNGECNSVGETWNEVMKKCIKDDELFRGYYMQIIWNRAKQIQEVYHIEFSKVRCSKDLTKFYVKNDWADFREKPRCYDAFNVNNPYGSQIFYKKEYNPTSEVYPLPAYFQGLNYIESDIEVSRHLLGMAKQSFVGSTLINLNNGDPINEEKRGEIERGLLRKFTGDSGKRVVIMFNKSRDNAAEIVPLGTSTLTKEDFTNVNNLIQQEIFVAHQIISPVLHGISTSGSLGQRNEIRDAYEIWNNTYVKERQQEFEFVFTKIRNLAGEQGEFVIQPVEPLKFEFTESIVSQNLTKDEIRELMGREPLDSSVKTQAQIISDNINALSPLVANKVLESMTPDEIRSLAGLVPAAPSGVTTTPNGTIPTKEVPMQSNDAIKNLSGRQYQNVMRIVRQFGNGKLNKQQASLMLKNGFGFTDADVNTFLGIDDSPLTDDEVQQFSMDRDLLLLQELEKIGSKKSDFKIHKSKGVTQSFAIELDQLEANVLSILTKEKGNVTPEIIAKSLKVDVAKVNSIIKNLIDESVIESVASKINTAPNYKVIKPVSELAGENSTIEFKIMYSYEWREIVPINERDTIDHPSRAFCKTMLKMSNAGKFWSRADIESLSVRLGYSVFDRVGGWWTSPINPEPYQCRHQWVSHLVTKK